MPTKTTNRQTQISLAYSCNAPQKTVQ